MASKLAPSFENSIDKYIHPDALENLLALARRAEMVFESNCLLLTELSLSDSEFSSCTIKIWIQKMVPHLEKLLTVRVMLVDLMEYLNSSADASIMHDELIFDNILTLPHTN